MWGECRLEVHDNIGTITESSMGGQWSLVACCFAVSLGPLWTTWGVQSTAAGSNPGRGTCRNEGERGAINRVLYLIGHRGYV